MKLRFYYKDGRRKWHEVPEPLPSEWRLWEIEDPLDDKMFGVAGVYLETITTERVFQRKVFKNILDGTTKYEYHE